MAKPVLTSFLLFIFALLAWAEIFGKDDRVALQDLRSLQERTAVTIVDKNFAQVVDDGQFIKVDSAKLSDMYFAPDQADDNNFKLSTEKKDGTWQICKEQKFADQRVVPGAICGGQVLGGNILVTANYCSRYYDTAAQLCEDNYILVGLTSENVKDKLPVAKHLYECKKVLKEGSPGKFRLDKNYVIYKLDRVVEDSENIKWRNKGLPPVGTELTAVGPAFFVPAIKSTGVVDHINPESKAVRTNMDLFDGGAGAGAFNGKDGTFEGLVTSVYGSRPFWIHEEGCLMWAESDPSLNSIKEVNGWVTGTGILPVQNFAQDLQEALLSELNESAESDTSQ